MARRQPLDPETHAQLARLTAELPERQILERLSLTPEAFARALALLPIQAGTRALIKNGLEAHSDGRAA